MVLQWCRKMFSYMKRWSREEATLDLAIEMYDHYVRQNGVGLTHTADNMAIGRSLVLCLNIFMDVGVYVFACLYYIFNVMKSEQIIDTLTPTVRAGLTTLGGLLVANKYSWFILSRRDVSRVISQARSLGSVPLPKSSWRWSTGVSLGMTIIISHRLVLPILLQKKVLPEEVILIPGLENNLVSPSYEITYFIIVVSMYANNSLLITFYGVFICIAGHLASHYQLLSEELENLLRVVTVVDEGDSVIQIENIDRGLLKEKLSHLISQHCKLIDVTKELRSLYNALMGIEFGCLTLGLGIFLVTTSKVGVTFMLDYFLFFFVILSLYCITGEMLSTAAEGFQSSVWTSGWENLDPSSRKTILLILVLAQKPVYLTAGTFIPISYRTWMKAIKMCFSIFAAFDAARDD